jgi:predicted DNA binding CopG/RHH family protein
MKNKKLVSIDLTQLEPIDKLDSEEAALHEALTKGNFTFDSSRKTQQHYAELFESSRKQRRAISLRIPEQDYLAIRTKAAELGLPYQALINSLIHQYVMGASNQSRSS